ncbi:MAG: response regulator [Mucilaginibacter sp.]
MSRIETILNDDNKHGVLVIEDNPGDFALVEEFLTDGIKYLHLAHAKTCKEAKGILSDCKNEFDVILLDLSLPDNTGVDLINEIVALSKGVPVIILTGYEDVRFGATSLSLGVSDYLLKDDLTPQMLYKSILYSSERKKVNLQLLNYIHAIEDQNKQLRDIAWIQSHVVRAPLARMVGLIDLFKNDNNSNEENDRIVDYLLESRHQLDDIIKDISEKADEKLESQAT